MQACDLMVGFDARHGPAYRLAAATNVMQRKQDQGRKGHHPRIGRGSRPETDIVGRLIAFMASCGTTPGPRCTKQARPHARCPACAPSSRCSSRAGRRGSRRRRHRPSPT